MSASLLMSSSSAPSAPPSVPSSGQFTGVPTPTLGAAAIRGALAQAGVAPDQVDEVIMGCVLPAGLGQAPARQAAIGAGIPTSAPAARRSTRSAARA